MLGIAGAMNGVLGGMANAGITGMQQSAYQGTDGMERQQSIADQKKLSAEGRADALLAAQLKNEQERTKTIAEMSHVGPNACAKNAESMAR